MAVAGRLAHGRELLVHLGPEAVRQHDLDAHGVCMMARSCTKLRLPAAISSPGIPTTKVSPR